MARPSTQYFQRVRWQTPVGTGVDTQQRRGMSMSEAVTTEAQAPTVLVVDDEPGIVDSLQKVFERESLRVLTARGGAEALELLRKEPVSVVLTDLVMPGMSGLDLLKASRSVSPETETILMTAYGTVENAVEAMRQGAYDFVTKPLKR